MRLPWLLILAGCGRVGFEPIDDAITTTGACIDQIAVGEKHACARFDDGSLWCWGRNLAGRLGTGVIEDRLTPPARVVGDSYAAVAAGTNHTCGLHDTGVVECWGSDGSDELGPAMSDDSGTPIEVTGVTATAVHTGGPYTCVNTATQVLCWGDGDAGQLGRGVIEDMRDIPLPIAVTTSTDVFLAEDHACALVASYAACWGVNGYGQLGVDPMFTVDTCQDRADNLEPCALAGVNVTSVSAPWRAMGLGFRHSCAVTTTNDVLCWGQGTSGQLGTGQFITTPTPTRVVGPATTDSIAVGENAACELFLDQTVACWGQGTLGFLGDGSSINRAVPGPVPGLANVTQIDTAPHGRTICALNDQGVWCWGDNAHGIVLSAPTLALTPQLVLPRCP